MDTEEATAEESKSMKSTKSRGHKDHNSDIIFLYFSLSFYPGKQRKKVETRQGGARDAYWHRKQWDDSDGDRLHGREVTVAAPEAASNGLGAMILYALLIVFFVWCGVVDAENPEPHCCCRDSICISLKEYKIGRKLLPEYNLSSQFL
ncbi:uncharacterized protein LOC107636810 isoform X1 [Arachis ipaensis]|uniref:uncharacterized protein LOC107636810 isoform X1 n=3 Tax=Arachis ipaensis TaxID=130454 RepID=UPI000A2B4BBF|nr:uncharacterized protein LOC107636810 isoform X1 [Arachis ipaensis]